MKPIPIALGAAAVLSTFFFPWPFTVLLASIAAFFIPPMVFIVGCLLDFQYFGWDSIPYFSLFGLIGMSIAYYVQSFIKTRII